MAMKETKEEIAIESATDVFTRFGYARTTMGDIAARAGMSRPALYLLFPDKQAAFDRVIERMDRRKLDEIAAVLPTLQGLEAKLLHACLAWGLHGVELAAVHPDAADLFDLRFSSVRQVYANFQNLVADLIADGVARSGQQAAPSEIARTLVYSMRGFRDAAADVEDMRRMISIHVRTVARALELG
jgi:AcrR family transcriptional regulator